MTTPIDFPEPVLSERQARFCVDGKLHSWGYSRGLNSSYYECSSCGIRVTKAVLKHVTDH